MSQARVALLMGSKNDLPKLQGALDVLDVFQMPYTVRVLSAHRTPHESAEFAENAEKNGVQVILCAAGLAAHLAGVVAAHSQLPVIGIPVEGGPFNGQDALLATVQMPGGIPVATVGVGRGGVKNAALLALRIIALGDEAVRTRMREWIAEQSAAVLAADASLQVELGS